MQLYITVVNSNSPEMSGPYFQVVRTSLPQEYLVQVDAFCKSPATEAFLEALIRFTAGGEPSIDASDKTCEEWAAKQSEARKRFDDLVLPNGHKRAREDDADALLTGVKRPKLPEVESNVDDPPML